MLSRASAVVSIALLAGGSVARAQEPSGSYLPLAVGNRWELRASTTSDPMVLEVTDRSGDVFVVRWINPWIQATFRFRVQDTRVLLAGLDTGQGNASMPADTVYWDFGKRKGDRWKTAVGDGEVSDRGMTVQTPSGSYRDAVEVRTIDQKGQSMYWTFAPGAGLVRFGRGRDAYLLTSRRTGAGSAPLRSDTSRSLPPPASTARPGMQPLLVGVDATPHSKSGSGKAGKRSALQQAWESGLAVLHTAPKWNELEKSPGRYELADDVQAIGEFADEHDLPIALNVRIVDTNQRSMPKEYERWRFDDEKMADRLRAALQSFPQSFRRHTRYLAIGNEVDGYFGSHRDEIEAYAVLVQRVAATARQVFPGTQLTVNFTFGAAGDMSRYRRITDLTDIASFTYYPLNGDFTMRDPSVAGADIDRMLDSAAGRKLYIQEIGYASAERLKSSPQKQADFYANAFQAIRERRDRIVGVTFLFMSDLPQSIVDYLGSYYRLPNSDNFKAYIQTLGLLRQDGTPKPAWDVFRREALGIRTAREGAR